MPTRLLRIIGVLALAAVLAACSAVKLAYNALPDVAFFWLDGYADFNDDQSPRVREDLVRLHSWHRANELPRLADMLARMEQLAPGDVTAAQACGFVTELQARALAVADEAEPVLVTTAMRLTGAQLRHLQRKYQENNAKWRSEWIEVPTAERHDKRFRQILERYESIYGRLDEPQRKLLRDGLAASVFDPQRTLAMRQRRQQDLLQVVRHLGHSDTSFAEARSAVRGYLQRALRSPDEAERAYQQAVLDEGCRLFAAVHASTSAAQRTQAAQRLRAYQRDLRELIGQPAS